MQEIFLPISLTLVLGNISFIPSDNPTNFSNCSLNKEPLAPTITFPPPCLLHHLLPLPPVPHHYVLRLITLIYSTPPTMSSHPLPPPLVSYLPHCPLTTLLIPLYPSPTHRSLNVPFPSGVTQWKMNCEADQEDQDKMAIQEWVTTMEGRIRKLGGQGVERFLSNLFRAFEGMFLGAETPRHSAQKVLDTLQAIREISAVSCETVYEKATALMRVFPKAVGLKPLGLVFIVAFFVDNNLDYQTCHGVLR